MSVSEGVAWRPVAGYPNYEVSSHGQVRSRPRERTRGGVLKPQRNSRGYWHVALCRDGETRRVRVHLLVAEAFHGPRPPGQMARHFDDDQDNNRADNLVWGTRSENTLDAVKNSRSSETGHNNARKTHCPQRHRYTPENTYVGPDGKRRCRTCRSGGAR